MSKPKDREGEALRLLKELDYHLQTTHLDMGGKHRYSIKQSGFKIISEIKGFLARVARKDFGLGEYHEQPKK